MRLPRLPGLNADRGASRAASTAVVAALPFPAQHFAGVGGTCAATQATHLPKGHKGGRFAPCEPALLAQLVEHFHGKEGVAGSSPAEGFIGSPRYGGVSRLLARPRYCSLSRYWVLTGSHWVPASDRSDVPFRAPRGGWSVRSRDWSVHGRRTPFDDLDASAVLTPEEIAERLRIDAAIGAARDRARRARREPDVRPARARGRRRGVVARPARRRCRRRTPAQPRRLAGRAAASHAAALRASRPSDCRCRRAPGGS